VIPVPEWHTAPYIEHEAFFSSPGKLPL
jgi:hypothetical protein